MLYQALVKSLKESNRAGGVDLSALDFLIPDVKSYLAYSMKFEINRNNFRNHVKAYLQEFLNGFYLSDACLKEVLDVCFDWYVYYLEVKSLVKATSSLKSDLKRIYKKYNNSLDGFDRFMHFVNSAFNEAYNVYTVILYEPDAIKYNINFSEDRGSCYINSRPDYLKAIRQANSYYCMIYKNNKPITRVWLLCDNEGIAVFNPYGYKFKKLHKFFFDSEDDFYEENYSDLEDAIGVYVNNDTILISSNLDPSDFVYDLECPQCGCLVDSSSLEWVDSRGLCCQNCNGRVWSEVYQDYIDEGDAYYSQVHDSYIHFDDSIYSHYYDDRILEDSARKVYNIEIDDKDYVLKDDAVYSEYYGSWLIKDQTVFSEYYHDYLLIDSMDTVYSKYLNTYVDKNDENIVFWNDDYIPIEEVEKEEEV